MSRHSFKWQSSSALRETLTSGKAVLDHDDGRRSWLQLRLSSGLNPVSIRLQHVRERSDRCSNLSLFQLIIVRSDRC